MKEASSALSDGGRSRQGTRPEKYAFRKIFVVTEEGPRCKSLSEGRRHGTIRLFSFDFLPARKGEGRSSTRGPPVASPDLLLTSDQSKMAAARLAEC